MNETQVRENFGNVVEFLRSVVLEKVSAAYERFVEENEIPQKLSSNRDVINQVTDEQTDLGYDDFIQKEDVSQNEINDQVRDYVNDNYDSDFFMSKIAEKINYDQLQEELTEDLILNLMNTEPYNVVSREYWYSQARRVPNIKELAEYIKTDGLEPFTEKYAPDWEEIAKQNQD